MKKTFTVTGMKCEHCEARVENALKELNGVNSAKADHNANNVTVDYDEANVTPEQMTEAVNALGRYEMNA
jgi:copper chaperone